MDYKQSILALFGAFVFLILGWSYLIVPHALFGRIDECHYDRFNETLQQRHHVSVVPKLLFWSTIVCFIMLGVRAYFTLPQQVDKKGSSRGDVKPQDLVFYLGTGTTFYSITYCVSKVIEYFLNDVACSRHSNNGISGHYLFHVYFLLLFFYLAGFVGSGGAVGEVRVEKRGEGLSKDLVFVVVFGAATCLSTLTLVETWLGGFHSPRQILYGVLLSLVSHFTFVYLTENCLFSQKVRLQVVMGLVIGLVVLLLISTVIGNWPFTGTDFVGCVLINAATIYVAVQQDNDLIKSH